MEFGRVLLILVVILMTLIYSFNRRYQYWSKHGIPFIEPTFPYGSIRGIMDTIQFNIATQSFYNKLKGKASFGGLFSVQMPVILATDLNFVKKVLVKDFKYFEERPIYYNKEKDPLSAHLFNVNGEEWRSLRPRLTSTFTSSKMKFMFSTILKIGDQFKDTINDLINQSDDIVEIKELLGRFTTDVIGSCAFGIDCYSLANPDKIFLKMGRKIFSERRHPILISFLITNFQQISRFLGVKTTRDDVSDFFLSIVKDTVKYREENNVKRNDLMDIMIKLKNQNGDDGNPLLTVNEIAAQAFIFFIAGFETSSTTMTFCLYELALNESIQEMVREEVKSVLAKHGNKLTYEACDEMVHLNRVIKETLRKYPPVGTLLRKAVEPYHVPECNYTFPKGMSVWIPSYAIQNDPEHYPDPEKFDPDGFLPENEKLRNPLTYLPFGDGPRNCIGYRFGQMQVRIGLSMLLSNFKISVCSNTQIPMKFAPKEYILSPKGGLYLKIEKL